MATTSVVPDSASSARSRDALLTTKLYAPRARPGLVPRPRLLEKLERGLAQRLILVSAPAGFGKTTLVGEWLRRGERPFTWLSLDESDDDPTRFLAYLVAALQSIDPTWGQAVQRALQSPQPPPPTVVLTALVNEVAVSRVDFVLVLDDYHLISAPPVHEVLAFLLDNMPPPLHLVILTRADPPFPLARLRARGELTEIRADDLRFSATESAAFIDQVMGLDLTPGQIVALEARTEGWVAGLQLAALSLQRLRGDEDIASFIDAFAGSHRYVMDYLIEEVFNRQPPDVQAFLLQTSILDRLCGPLCDALVGGSDGSTVLATGGQQMLERLEQANLFTAPLDHHRGWYRYHQLFADLLRDRLRQTQPGRIPALHRRASAWYESAGLADEAFHHAFAADDIERAVRVAEVHADPMIRRGELVTLLHWLESLPEDAVRSRPRLSVNYGWALFFVTGQLELAEPHLQNAERTLAQRATSLVTAAEEHEIALLLGEITLLRLCFSRFAKHHGWAIEVSRQALDSLDKDDHFARGLIYLNLGIAYRRSGDLVDAARSLQQAMELCEAANHTVGATIAAFYLARVYEIQGRLHLAAAICQRVLQAAAEDADTTPRPVPGAGLLYVGMADILCEWNSLEGAELYLQKALRLGKSGGHLDLLVNSQILQARVNQARGDLQAAREAMEQADRVVARMYAPQRVVDMVAVHQARLWLAQGNLQAAARWAETIEPTVAEPSDTLRDFQLITLAGVRLEQGRLEEAESLLRPLLVAAEADGRVRHVISILAVQALVRQARGDMPGALAVLGRAVALAEPEGYVRTLVDAGRAIFGLLRLAQSRGMAPDYIGRLLAGCDAPAAQPLVEPLTPRELEVLRLVGAGLRNKEIAAQLVISVATVKRHITNIYGKLGVSHRTQAVSRARELNLL